MKLRVALLLGLILTLSLFSVPLKAEDDTEDDTTDDDTGDDTGDDTEDYPGDDSVDYVDSELDENTIEGFNSSTWEDGVVAYTIDPKFEDYQKKRIRDAIGAMNAQALCVQFIEMSESDKSYISFVKDESRCMSEYIGFADVGEQSIYLAPNCSTPRYIYWVLLQVLGLPAEHMRPDRDHYINIKWENINPAYETAFKKYSYIDARIAKLEYDYESRLHYANEMFATEPGLKTIVARGDSSKQLSNYLSPTFLDYKKVAALYCDGEVLPQEPIVIQKPSVDDPEDLPPPPTVRKPRPNALPAIIAGLAPLLNPPPVNRTVSNKCKCFAKPDVKTGSCDGIGAFQWQQMWEKCRDPLTADDPVCDCDDMLVNPCYCRANDDWTACVKTCPRDLFTPNN